MIPQEEILKSLVKQVDNSVPSKVLHQTEDTVDEILFESNIDGICYYLVRSRPRGNHSTLLSPREREITKLVALGLDNKSIGKKLGITHWTVATYLRRIFSKLGVSSRTAMIARLLEENLLCQ
ncbi:MAG TPA: helix-turn-helix transcriptional regulator [Cyanobacteria bacterium UBA11372]|nr:helix-turn-helix transcriptional regulator [Cyanobacteria bacterium UBA11372]